MRRRQPQPPSGRGETAAGAATPNGSTRYDKLKVARRHPAGGEVVASSHLAVRPNLGRPARLDASSPRSSSATELGLPPSMLCGWARRNWDQVGPIRRGAGPRPEARGAQYGRDRGGRDADPELQQLAHTHVAPARVLSRQPPDQVARLGRKRRTPRPGTAAPTSLTQCPVPAAKRLRADRKAGPPLRREDAAGRCEQGLVGGRVPRPLSTAPEDRQPVAQHDDLKLPLTTTAREHADEAAQKPVQQTHQHDAQSEPARRAHQHGLPGRNRFFLPHRRCPGVSSGAG
jgi:hypothetical protein